MKSILKYKSYLIFFLSALLASCETPPQFNPAQPATNNASLATQSSSGSGVLNSVATGVASGIGAGMGMAAGHHIINGAINKWRNRPSRYLFSRRGRY
jgi:hypothetical protein